MGKSLALSMFAGKADVSDVCEVNKQEATGVGRGVVQSPTTGNWLDISQLRVSHLGSISSGVTKVNVLGTAEADRQE